MAGGDWGIQGRDAITDAGRGGDGRGEVRGVDWAEDGDRRLASGAGGAGEPSRSNSEAGNGGPGRASDITGSIVFYAGGGGGSQHSSTSQGGTGGIGGGGGGGNNGHHTPGTNGLGGGGGGANNDPAPVGGYGGSGVVIIRY